MRSREHERADYERATNNELIAERSAERTEARLRPMLQEFRQEVLLEMASLKVAHERQTASLRREIRRLRAR